MLSWKNLTYIIKTFSNVLYLSFQVYRRDISQPWLQRYYARDWELTGDPYKAQVTYAYFILIQNLMINDPKFYNGNLI